MKKGVLITFLFLLTVGGALAQEWEYLDSGITNQLNGISCPSQRVCYIAGGAPYIGGDGIIIKTIDGGGNWTVQELPTADYLKAIDCANNNICYAAGDGVILKTADGDEWQIVNRTEQTFWDIDALSSSTAVAVGNLGSTLRTTNGGISWSGYLPPRTGTFRESLHAVFFVDENTGWRGGDAGFLQKSINGGVSWIDLNSGSTLGISDIFSRDGTVVWATGSFDYILKSEDGGDSWTQYRVLSAGGFPAIEFANDTFGWALGNGVIEESIDGGETWADAVLEVRTFFRDIDCPSASLCYAVGDDGTLLRWGESSFATIRPTNYTLQVPDYPEEEQEEPALEEVSCQPVMDDCEIGWNPMYQYNESGCAVGYTCVEDNIDNEKVKAFLQGLSAFSPEELSEFLSQVPGLSPNEKISVYVTRKEATPLVLSFRLEEGKVTAIALKEQEDWTLKAETTEETLNKILAAEDPATAALAAINSKEIQLSGRTFGKKVKLAFLRMGLKLAGIFG